MPAGCWVAPSVDDLSIAGGVPSPTLGTDPAVGNLVSCLLRLRRGLGFLIAQLYCVSSIAMFVDRHVHCRHPHRWPTGNVARPDRISRR